MGKRLICCILLIFLLFSPSVLAAEGLKDGETKDVQATEVAKDQDFPNTPSREAQPNKVEEKELGNKEKPKEDAKENVDEVKDVRDGKEEAKGKDLQPKEEAKALKADLQGKSRKKRDLGDDPKNTDKGVVRIKNNHYSSLEGAIEAAIQGDTMTLVAKSLDITKPVLIPGEKGLTLDLGGNTLVSKIEDAHAYMLKVTSKSKSVQKNSFILKNGFLTARDLNKDGKTSGALWSRNANVTLEDLDISNFHKKGKGGAISIDNSAPVETIIKTSKIHNNSIEDTGYAQGGGLYLNNDASDANTQILNNEFVENVSKGLGEDGVAAGGGARVIGYGSILIDENTFTENKVSTEKSKAEANGGGLALADNINSKGSWHITLRNNSFKKNHSSRYGGGASL